MVDVERVSIVAELIDFTNVKSGSLEKPNNIVDYL